MEAVAAVVAVEAVVAGGRRWRRRRRRAGGRRHRDPSCRRSVACSIECGDPRPMGPTTCERPDGVVVVVVRIGGRPAREIS